MLQLSVVYLLSVYIFCCFVYRNLDETTKSVYKENVRLSEALSYHMKEGELLKKQKERLEEESEHLRGDKEINDMMVQEKVSQTKNQKQSIKDVSTWSLLSLFSMLICVYVCITESKFLIQLYEPCSRIWDTICEK